MRIAIDFDGTISEYIRFDSKEGGVGKYGNPVKGAREFINKLFLLDHYIIIWTTRGYHEKELIIDWLERNKISFNYVATQINEEVERSIEKYPTRKDVPRKINADVYIDDKAIRFNGIWDDDLFQNIINFKPWWREEESKRISESLNSLRDLLRAELTDCGDFLGDSTVLDHQKGYEKVVIELAETRRQKCLKYGEDRYNVDDDEFNYWMCFSDVYRKYIRIKQLTKLAISGDDEAHESLRDAYADIANYGIMGVQILDKIKDKNED